MTNRDQQLPQGGHRRYDAAKSPRGTVRRSELCLGTEWTQGLAYAGLLKACSASSVEFFRYVALPGLVLVLVQY